MKYLLKNKILVFFIFFIFILSVNNSSFCFTEEEQKEIDNTVSKMIENSVSSGCKYNLKGSTNKIFLCVDKTYNNKTCKYMALMYWNSQYNITLTDNIITAKCTWYNNHELVSFYYDNSLNCIGYHIDDLYEGNSVTFENVNGYFSSTFTVKNKKGETVSPFFPQAPQVTITEMMKVEELPMIMNKALQMIIPVGLAILSIGLVIYVVKSVILQVT